MTLDRPALLTHRRVEAFVCSYAIVAPMRLHIALDDDLVAEVDRRAGPRRRSAFIAELIQRGLSERPASGLRPDSGMLTSDPGFDAIRGGLLHEILRLADEADKIDLPRLKSPDPSDAATSDAAQFRACCLAAYVQLIGFHVTAFTACLECGSYGSALSLARTVVEALNRQILVASTAPTPDGRRDLMKLLKSGKPAGKLLQRRVGAMDPSMHAFAPVVAAVASELAAVTAALSPYVHAGPAEFAVHYRSVSQDVPSAYPAALVWRAATSVVAARVGSRAVYLESIRRSDLASVCAELLAQSSLDVPGIPPRWSARS